MMRRPADPIPSLLKAADASGECQPGDPRRVAGRPHHLSAIGEEIVKSPLILLHNPGRFGLAHDWKHGDACGFPKPLSQQQRHRRKATAAIQANEPHDIATLRHIARDARSRPGQDSRYD